MMIAMYSDVYFCLNHIMSPINPFFFSMNEESPIFDVSNSAPAFFWGDCNLLILLTS